MRQELETLASRKQLDDVKVQFEQLRAERAAARVERQIDELWATLRKQHAKHVEDVASLEQFLKSRDAERSSRLRLFLDAPSQEPFSKLHPDNFSQVKTQLSPQRTAAPPVYRSDLLHAIEAGDVVMMKYRLSSSHALERDRLPWK